MSCLNSGKNTWAVIDMDSGLFNRHDGIKTGQDELRE